MAKRKLKVGVIGVGAIAQEVHLPAWKELEAEGRVELAAVCDLLPENLNKAAKEYEAPKKYKSFKKMLNENNFDIIDVCTHNRCHCPAVVAALNAGAHTMVEKPMAMSAKESREMIKASKANKRKLMTGQHMRFETANEKLKELVERGDLGQIYYGQAQYLRRRGIPGWGKFHIKRESLGGALIDIGVHVLDLAFWLMGCPKPVAASGKTYRMFGDRDDLCNADWGTPYPPKEFDVEDYASAIIRFEKGITLHLEVSWAANIPDHVESLRILGDKAGISTNPLQISSYENDALTSKHFDWLPEKKGHREEIRHFTECVEKDLPVRVKPEESLQIQMILDAIYESSRKNKEIRIK